MSEYQPSLRNRPRLRETAMAELLLRSISTKEKQGNALCERGKISVDKECFNV